MLLLDDGVDDWVVASLHEFDGKPLQSVAQGAADLGTLEDEAEKQASGAGRQPSTPPGRQAEGVPGRPGLGRAGDQPAHHSPACIVANEPETEINLVQRMRGSGLPRQPVLEINPGHPLVARLNRQPDDPRLADWAHVLYNQAVLTLGARIDDPAAFVSRLNDLLVTLAQETDGADGG